MYYKIGQLACMCLVQGDTGFNILSLAVYEYVCGEDISNIKITFKGIMHLQAKNLINEVSRYILVGYALYINITRFNCLNMY